MSVTLSQFGDPPSNYRANAMRTIAILDEIFAAFPGRFRFTSGYRSAARNAAVNGVPSSYHLTGQAGDFVPRDGRYNDKAAISQIVGKYGYEVIMHDVGSGLHYHIEPAPGATVRSPTGGIAGTADTNTWIIVGGLLVVVALLLPSEEDYY